MSQQWWKALVQLSKRFGKTKKSRPSKRVWSYLGVERLEDRTVPTVVYNPVFGPEILVPSPNNHYQTLSSPNVYLIFWGKYWGQGTGNQQANSLALDAQAILASAYLSKITEYGSDGKALYANSWIDNTSDPTWTYTDPTGKVKTANAGDPNGASVIQAEIANAIADSGGIIPAPRTDATQTTAPIYVVITDPTKAGSNGGYNMHGGYTPSNGSANPINMISVGIGAGPDEHRFGLAFSHEMVEDMTDPTGNDLGVTVVQPAVFMATLHGQVADGEPELSRGPDYEYQLSSEGRVITVQPWWSDTTQAYIVPDGNTQSILLDAIWKGIDLSTHPPTLGSFNGKYNLRITGDQFASPNDKLIIDDANSGTNVILNGETFSFTSGMIQAITVDLGQGSNTIDVLELRTGVALTISQTGGSNTVNIGNDGHVSNVFGTVAVEASGATVTIDDSNDSIGQNLTVGNPFSGVYQVGWDALGSVQFDDSHPLAALNIKGGTSADTFNFLTSPRRVTTTLDTRYGNAHVNILATAGPLFITSSVSNATPGQAQDTVLIGNNGSLADILSPVIVSNQSGHTSVALDDSNDNAAANFLFTHLSINRGSLNAPGQQLLVTNGGISSLVFYAGSGNAIITVLDSIAPTTIDTGPGNDQVNVSGTGVPLHIEATHFSPRPGQGHDQVTLSGNLFRSISVSNGQGSTALTVDASSSAADQIVTLNSIGIAGLTPMGTAITYGPGVSSLTVLSGSGIDTYNVESTATGVPTNLIGNASTTVNVGSGNVQGINAPLNIESSAGAATLNVDDHLDTTRRTVTVANLGVIEDNGDSWGSIIGLAPAAINYEYQDISNLTISTGTGNNNVNVLATGGLTNAIVQGTPTTLIGGGGSDLVDVGFLGTVRFIVGTLTIENPSFFTTVNIDDSADQSFRNVTLSTFTPFGDFSFGAITGLAPAAIDYKYFDTSSVTLETGSAGSTVNVLATGANTKVIGNSIIDTVNLGYFGSVQSINGDLAIENDDGSTTINVDDSLDPTYQTVTLDTITPGTSSFGSITGLAPAPITYENFATFSITLNTSNVGATVNVFATGTLTNLIGNSFIDTVNVGNAGSIQSILGDLNIENPAGFTTLNVDDNLDSTGRTVTVANLGLIEDNGDSWGTIIGLAPAAINYEYQDISNLTIDTGVGNNTVNVLATGGLTNAIVQGTPTTLIGGGGSDTVNVGFPGTVRFIVGTLTIENPTFFTTVNIDASADQSFRNVTLSTFTPLGDSSFGSITGLAPAAIDYEYSDTSSLTLETGSGGSTVNVLATGTNTKVIGNSFIDTVNLGYFGSVQDIQGYLTIENSYGHSTINVDDSLDPTYQTVTLDTFTPGTSSFGSITGLAPAPITYENFATFSITLNTSNVGATVNVLATGTLTNLIGNGLDTVNVGNAGSVQGIQGELVLTDPPYFLTLSVDDSADTIARTGVVLTEVLPNASYGVILGLAPATIAYQLSDTASPVTIDGGSGGNTFDISGGASFQTINLNTGTGNDTVNVRDTAAPLNVHGQSGADTVTVGNLGNVQGILGAVSIDNIAGSTALTIDDSLDSTPANASIGDTAITGLAPAAIGYDPKALSSLTVNGGTGGNTFSVTKTIRGVVTTINTGIGNDTVNVTPSSMNLNDLGSDLTIHGTPTARPTVNIFNSKDPRSLSGRDTYLITSTLTSFDDPITVHYTNVGAVNLFGGSTGAYDVESIASGATYTIIAGAGPNTFNVVPGVQGLTINGLGSGPLTIDDSADAANATYTITDSTVQVNDLPPIIYTGAQSLIVNGGSGTDIFNVLATGAATSVTLNTGTGSNTVNVGNSQNGLDGLLGPLTVNGSPSGANVLNVYDQATAAAQTYNLTAQTISRPGSSINYANLTHVVLFTGSGGNVIFVASTPAGTTTDVFGGTGNDEFVLYDGTLNDILGPVNLHGGGGTGDFVDFNDFPNAVGQTYTLTANTFTRTGIAPVTFDPLSQVILQVGQAANQVNVLGVAAGTFESIGAGTLSTLTVGSVAPGLGGTLANIMGPFRVESSTGQTPTVIIDDSGDTTSHPQASFQNDAFGYSLTGLAPAPIYFQLDPASSVTVRGGSGDDTFSLANLPASLGLTIDGGAGANALNVNDQATAAAQTYKLTAQTISRPGAAINYANFTHVTLFTGNGGNTISVATTAAGTTTDVFGGSGNDEFVLYNGTLNDILGPVNLHGGGGSGDFVVFDDFPNSVGQTYTLTANTFTRSGIAPVTFDPMSQVILFIGQAANQVNVLGVAPGTFETIGAGTLSTVTIGSLTPGLGGTLAGILGPFRVESYAGQTPTVLIDDSGDTTARQASFQNTAFTYSLTGLTPAQTPIYLQLDPNSSVKVRSGTGTDTFTLVDLPSFGLAIDGGAGNDTLVGPNTPSTWVVNGVNAGLVGGVSFAAIENLNGGSGGDVFQFQTGARLSGRIDGGIGVATLDYSVFPTGVAVNLAAGTAAGTGGVSRIHTVIGSLKNDTITGNLHADTTLYANGGLDKLQGGGDGRETYVLAATQKAGTVVTGGAGTDTLVGADIANTWNLIGAAAGNVNGVSTFTGIANLTGGTKADTFKFQAGGSVAGTINGSGGGDTLNYSGNSGAAVAVNLQTGAATATGGFSNISALVGSSAATDTLTAANSANTVSITGANAGNVNGSFTFSAIENLVGGTGADTFLMMKAASRVTSIDGGGGSDTLAGANVANAWTLTGAGAGTLNTTALVNIVNLVGGTNADTFVFQAGGSVVGTINGNGGADKLDYSGNGGAPIAVNLQTGAATSTGGISNISALVGSSATTNKLTGTDTPNTWAITGTDSGKINGLFTFIGVQNLLGGLDSDTFAFHTGGQVAGSIHGQGSANALDYSTDAGNVLVNLRLGRATGVGGTVKSIQSITGGQGNDILVGNGQETTLTGGGGRDLLIAGPKGPTLPTLLGNAGEDILVGGSTDYDTNLAALNAIMAEWGRTDLGYAARVNHLLHGGGLNGTSLLNSSTFHGNGGDNVLTGGAGLDLFFGSKALDQTDWIVGQVEVFIEGQPRANTVIDARGLGLSTLTLDNTPFSTAAAASFSLAPGVHTLKAVGGTGASLTFFVAADGAVDYDSSLDGVLSGRGTRTLVILSLNP